MQSRALRLLVVDDDTLQCRIIEAVASQMKIAVTCVGSFEAATNMLLNRPFDCISVDLSLGDRSGIELLRAISILETVPRVIIISGCDERVLNATVRMAIDVGIPDARSIAKPVDIACLRIALNALKQPCVRLQVAGEGSPDISSDRLRQALTDKEIYAAFQPKIDLSNGRIIGCEALARWNCRDLGMVPPDIFIAAAERHHHINELTLLMLEDAIQANMELIDLNPNFVMAVNISGSLISDAALPGQIERILDSSNMPAKNLLLEITETTAMADPGRAVDILLNLRLKGIGLSIDDFGTGYSSLSALARMPFNELKIDRSFVKNCVHDKDMWKIVSGSVSLAHSFGMTAVAEGIEDLETAEALAQINCDLGQGYLFAPALGKADLLNRCDDPRGLIKTRL